MMLVPQSQCPTLALHGSLDRFPVRRIYCVGQNYADHAREMGSDPTRQAPFFFSKPADAAVDKTVVAYPVKTAKLHHEVELVVCLGGEGADLSPDQADGIIFGYAVGLDLTRRDLQETAKKAGRPWDMAKGFDESAPVGAIVPGRPPSQGAIKLAVNGELRQSGDLNQMIWSVPEIIAELSAYVVLRPGDLIFTGTPAGVGAIGRGDVLDASIEGAPPLRITLR
jgi:fumarylpyruvate hydrolase